MVFTLTRFFRDGGSRGPTKLSLLEAENGGQYGPALCSLYFTCYWSLCLTHILPLHHGQMVFSFFQHVVVRKCMLN